MQLDKYKVEKEGLVVDVTIKQPPHQFVPIYEVKIPEISEGTRILIENKLKPELLSKVDVDMRELLDPKESERVKEKFKKAAYEVVKENFRNLDEKVVQMLVNYLVINTIGLGELEILSYDDHLEEITINSSAQPIWVYHKRWGWCKTNLKPKDEETIYNYASLIARRVGKQINVLNPLLDATLPDGSRVNATLAPISAFGNTLTIRKFSKNPWSVTRLIANNTTSSELMALIWLYVQYELSLIVAGGTGSGKTSFLNAISQFIPPNQRVISIEDTRELTLPKYLQWVPLMTRQPNPEGKGEVTMLDLLVNSLRMRPDRILVGEIRRKREAEILFEAMRTGHSVYATLHADNAVQTIKRLTTPPIDLPKEMMDAVGGIIVQLRQRRLKIRRSLEFAEVLESGDVNVLYRWNSKKDEIEQVGQFQKTIEVISLYSGKDAKEIERDLKEKQEVLEWMVAHEYYDVDEVGYLIAKYYSNKEELMEYVREDKRWEIDI
ncbi:MAG: type II/IV secretion system ATPase subunit [Candidatus Micrarchaeota archaeon]|nr:type II/IV secretion system ATPase subunit [Candidatus Micrarchaeota archaeon]